VGKSKITAEFRALAVICVLALLGCFGNFWWTSHVVNTSRVRWCTSMGYIGTLPLLTVPQHATGSTEQEVTAINAVIMHFRLRAEQLSCSKKQD